ncbi:uncharacterized protein LOC128555162 isoform X1 [Mercenaria mercenaria]|uniref:uncharacterized protein LOC128555162 isoform X1 n=1 Tax=Mercenaria mercenaria TaxID=6596 RepID=UPI00234F0968|nr:uncharacterized protein LOC128555162 isoform X1 [Mercenaria mercenaria]
MAILSGQLQKQEVIGISMIPISGSSVNTTLSLGTQFTMSFLSRPTIRNSPFASRAQKRASQENPATNSTGANTVRDAITPTSVGIALVTTPSLGAGKSLEKHPSKTPPLPQFKPPQVGQTFKQISSPRNNQTDIVTPVHWENLSDLLSGYDPKLNKYLVNGFRCGFNINFQGSRTSSNSPNLKSAKDHASVVAAKLSKELEANRIAGPFTEIPLENFRVSPIGVVPKKEPGEFRMIHHLSYPRNSGDSVNDQIPSSCTEVSYESIEDAIANLKFMGRGAFMAKTDIQSAFRIIPVHPDDRSLLGFKWSNQFYYDKCLPMGASSSCQIFETFSTALKWIAKNKFGIRCIVKILDDFLFIAPTFAEAQKALSSFCKMCNILGVPLNADKTFAPSTVMTFLGITLDSVLMQARLPDDKLAKAASLLQELCNKNTCTLRVLLSLIGLLNFACSVVKPGRAFLRRLINLSIGVKKLHFKVKLRPSARADMLMWLKFLNDFNGVSMFINDKLLTSDNLFLYTDASGAKGYGAVYKSNWFFGAFPEEWHKANITFLEFYPILLAVFTWGHLWKNHTIVFCTDNEALVAIINKQSSKLNSIMFLLRKLVLYCLQQNIHFIARHVKGKDNSIADALSRFQIQRFRQLAPFCNQEPATISQALQPKTLCKELKVC